ARALETKTSYDLEYMMKPFIAAANNLRAVLFKPEPREKRNYFDCDSDRAKAQAIADNLIKDWEVARELVEARGGKFIAILQPVCFFSKTRLDHLQRGKQDAKRRDQYAAVYPLLKAQIATQSGMYDFTDVLDKQEFIYIDFCHISPNGNRYVSERLLN